MNATAKGMASTKTSKKHSNGGLRRRSSLSFPPSTTLLAAYAKGEGVTQDFVTAYAWFTIAAPFYGDAEEKLALAEAKMTKEQIAEAQALAKELAKRIGQPSPNSP